MLSISFAETKNSALCTHRSLESAPVCAAYAQAGVIVTLCRQAERNREMNKRCFWPDYALWFDLAVIDEQEQFREAKR